jgi:hypothetical protein
MKQLRVAAAIVLAASLAGCAARIGYGYSMYDPYYGDYHLWADPEPLYYNQWVMDNHRDWRDFRRLRPEDQHQYWSWRHSPAAHPAERPGGPVSRGRR